jgi:outer membrane assembly lipoprotein YfiO
MDLGENASVNLRLLHPFDLRALCTPGRWSGVLACTSLALLLGGCATNGTPMPDERAAYTGVSEAIERGDCAGADAAVETLERHYSGGALLTNARLQTAYTCIGVEEPQRARRHTEALVSGDAFFAQRDHAHYLHAVAGYGIWKQGHEAAASRPELLADVEKARGAVEDFAVFVSRYPDSRYRDQALPYLVDLHEGLARSELAIARLDLERGEYELAAGRAGYVVEHFAATNSVPDARSVQQRALALAARPPEAVSVAGTGLIVSEPVRIDPDPPPAAVRRSAEPRPVTAAVAPAPRPAEPPPPPGRVDAPRPSAAASTAGSEGWIRAQPRASFTIQVLGLAQEAGVRDFLARHPMDRETAWFRTERNGADWFVAIAGSYPNAEAARRAIDSLPAEVRRNQPWIRSIGSVQDAIR